jgi:carbonic anhydrase/acetyltransferase-like protein (isoleucine patch superfamily)
VSTGAVLGSNASLGFWLDGPTGNARFGNSISIGNQLTVGSGANIGASLIIGNSATIGTNLIVGSGANIGTNLRVGTGANIGASLVVGSGATIGTNLIVGNNASIGGNLTVTGLISGSNLLANTVITNTVLPGSITSTPIIINAGTNYPGSGITSGIPFFLTGGQAVTYTSNDFVFVLNSSYSIQFSGGTGTATIVDIDMIRTPGGAAGIWSGLGRVSWSPGADGYLNLSSAGLTETFNQGLVSGTTYEYRPRITLFGSIPTNLIVFVYWTIQVLKR